MSSWHLSLKNGVGKFWLLVWFVSDKQLGVNKTHFLFTKKGHNFWKKQKIENSPTLFFCLIIGQRSLQISAKHVENSPKTNLKCALHSRKFSFRDMKENILWGVLPVHWDNDTKRLKINYPLMDQAKAYVTLTRQSSYQLQSGLKMLLLAENILCKIWIPPLAQQG